MRYSSNLSLTSATRWKWMINATPRPLNPRERNPVPSAKKTGFASRPVRTVAESRPYRDMTPWCPARTHNLLTPRTKVLEKLTGLQLNKKLPAFYGTRRFIAALTSARHPSPHQSISPGPTQVHMFRNKSSFYGEELSTPRPTPQAGPPLVGCPRLLIQYIRSYPPTWRPFLHPQPVDVPCRGDRDPLITAYP